MKNSSTFKQQNLNSARHGVLVAASLALCFAVGCSRDPNVRKQKYLESGKRYETNGKYKEAAIQISNALKVDHNFADAHYEMSKVDVHLGNMMGAYGELMKTVELQPSNVQARIDLGELLLAGKAIDRAEEQAKAVLAMNPNNADAYALLSGIAQKRGDNAEALKNIQHALQLDPNRSSFHTALGLLDVGALGSEPNAEQELRKATSLDPKSMMPRMVLASLLEKKGDVQGAQQQLEAAISASPTNLQARGALAGLYLRGGDKAKAEQVLVQAVDQMPDNEEASSLLAEFYVKTGQFDRAESVFADLTSKHPKNFPVKMTYARILADRKNYAKATEVANELAKSDAHNPQVLSLQAVLLMNTGKANDAFNLLQKAVKDSPNDVSTQLLLAKVAGTQGNLDVAETSYRAAAKLAPANMEAQSGLAEIAMRRNDVSMLSDLADKSIQAHPDFLPAYMWRGTAEMSRKEYDKAEADFQTVLKKSPDNPNAYLELGLLRVVQGHIPDARTMLEKALDKDPNSGQALATLMDLDMQAKQPAKALERVQAQIAKEPNNGSFYTDQALIQLTTKDYNGALQSSQKAMQLLPGRPEPVQIYTKAETALGNVDQAIAAWQQWVNAHPSDSRALATIGTLEEAKNDPGKATEYYKKALAIDSSNPVAANNLAYLMIDSGQDPNEALSLAQVARRGMPDAPDTADTLAWAYFAKGDYLSARDLLVDAVKANPESASMQFHLGMVYSKLNDKSDAILHLKKAASIAAPNTKTAQDANAELKKLG